MWATILFDCRLAMTTAIPESVRTLLHDDVTSFESLATLLVLHADPPRRWTLTELASRVGIPVDLALAVLNSLCARNLAARDEELPQPLFRYSAANLNRAQTIDALAHTFEENRVAVMNILNTKAIERVRSDALRTFSDAFIIDKKDQTDG